MTPTFIEQYEQLTAADPDRPVLTFGGTTLTRVELLHRSEALARHLVDLGVEEGDYVSLVLPNGVEMIVASLASWMAGAIPQPLSVKIARGELEAILEITGPRAVVGDVVDDLLQAVKHGRVIAIQDAADLRRRQVRVFAQ